MSDGLRHDARPGGAAEHDPDAAVGSANGTNGSANGSANGNANGSGSHGRDDGGIHGGAAAAGQGTDAIGSTPPTLELRGVDVAYDNGFVAVRGVSLAAAEGEIIALLGASGSGKSTLLRAIAGLERVAAGELRMRGARVERVPTHLRGCGMVFQDGQLFPHRSVARNIAYGLETSRVPRAQRRERVVEMLELVGLAGYGDRAITELSGGQQQRVALARAIAPRPRLLLLDEPLSALDRALRERLAGELRTILRSAATTAIHVTHDQEEAFTVADRIAVLHDGRLEQIGTADELLAAPATDAVADLLAADARIDGTVVARDGDAATVEIGAQRAEVRGLRGTVGQPVRLRVR